MLIRGEVHFLHIFVNCPFKVVETDAFKGLPALTEIDLSKNHLTSLGNVFGNLTNLRKINLKENKKLTIVNKDFLTLFKNIEQYGSGDNFQIDINDISLDCGCDIRWLLENRDMLHYFRSGARCASGILLKDVSML